MNIESHIESLLYRYDCVIIPGFGGFVVNPREAAINLGNDEFNPPARQITFNQNLTRNDGLLCDAVSAVDKISYEAAVKKVDDFNRENVKKLSEGLEVDIVNVGIFKYDTSGILQFEPNSEANFLRASFGLSSYRSPAIKREGVERVIEKQILKAIPEQAPPATPPARASSTVVTSSKEGVNLIKYWPAAAVILVLIVVSSVLMNTNVLNNISINFSDLNPFETSSESAYDERSDNLKFEEETVVKDEIELWLESIPEESIIKVNNVKKSKVAKRFHVIGGCFEIMVNAKKMLRKLERKGFEPTLAGKNKRGLQRVAFGSYATRAEAREVLKYIKNTQMKSSWLYVSKK